MNDTLPDLLNLLGTGVLDLNRLLQIRDGVATLLQTFPLAGHGLYFAAFVLLTAACLPGASVLMLVGAACMDFWLCLLLSNAASTVGAWMTFAAVRLGFRRHVAETRWLDRMEMQLAQRQIPFLISIRLAPVIPFVVFNVLSGLTSVRHGRFLWTSFLGMLPGTWLYVNAGSQLGRIQSLDEVLNPVLFASVAALAVVPWVLHALNASWTRD